MYIDIANDKLNSLMQRNNAVILAIESSCDETACAVMRGKELLSNIISSQIEIHRRFGGVVPEVASRNHTLAIGSVVAEAITAAGIGYGDIDCIAVTYGSGLLGALIVGVAYAKSLAYTLGVPIIKVNHIKGHIAANYIADSELRPPFMCLIASGGHTAIANVTSYNDIDIIGETVDDACGEAFDKVARILGLPYPGGVEIERLARSGNPGTIELPTPFKGEAHYNFSYSGLKTAVINYVHNCEQKGIIYNPADVAASFQARAVGIMVDNTMRAVRSFGASQLVVAGGVGANLMLRSRLEEQAAEAKVKVIYPPLKLCTDNAAMIASAARVMIESGVAVASDLSLDAVARIEIAD